MLINNLGDCQQVRTLSLAQAKKWKIPSVLNFCTRPFYSPPEWQSLAFWLNPGFIGEKKKKDHSRILFLRSPETQLI